MSLTLDLFSEQEVLLDRQQLEAESAKLREATERTRALREDLVFPADFQESRCERCGGPMRFTEFGERECFEDCDEPAPVALCDRPGFWAKKLLEMGEMRLLAARSFIELARRSGIEHEAVKPTGTDSSGQRTYDMDAVTRLANLMRGKPESLKPELKIEADWQASIEGLKAWKQGGKS